MLAFVAAGCGGGDDGGGAEGSEDVTGDISVMAIWGGEEQESFQAVIDGFKEAYPNVSVTYTSGGDNLAPLLSTAVEGGNPPDIAAIGQPGLMAEFAEQGAIQPIDDLRETIVDSFGESVADVGAVDGTQYGVMFKGANKSTVWYNVAAFEEAGVDAAGDLGGPAQAAATRSRRRASRRTRSAWTSAGRSPTSSRTSTSASRGRRCTTSWRSTRSRGRISP